MFRGARRCANLGFMRILPLLAASFFAALPVFGQGTPDCQFSVSFNSAGSQSPAVNNRPTTGAGGQGCVAWRVTYWTNASNSTSIQIEGSADSGGLPAGGYTALTPASGGGSGSGSTTNPALGTATGQIVTCCDYYPWIRITVNTLSSSGGGTVLVARIYGYKGTSAALSRGGGGGGSGITQLTQDVAAGPGSGSVPATVQGIETVPFCTGFAPMNGQILQYTTLLAPNPCYTAAAPAIQSTLTYYFDNSILASGTYTSGGSIVGTVGQTCTLSAFNGGGTGATATVALTGSNVIAGGTALVITAAGTQYTGAPTSATLGSGTAVCSGTATVATVLNVPSSDVSNVLPMSAAPYNPSAQTNLQYTVATGSGTVSEQTWTTPAGTPGISFMPAGVYECHAHANRTNAFSGTAVLQCLFQEVDASGAFIATIGTSEQSVALGLATTEYTLEFADGNVYNFASTSSRLQVVLQVVRTTVGVAGVLNVFAGGTADSHAVFPGLTVDSTTFVPYTGATADVKLGSHALALGGVLTSGVTGGGSQCLQVNNTGVVGGTGSPCGSGGSPTPYTAPVSSLTTLSVTAATHGMGLYAIAVCFDGSTPANFVQCSWSRDASGNIVFSWNPAFSGAIQISPF